MEPTAVDARAVPQGVLLVTYRSLRLALVLAVVMILISVVYESIRAGELRSSLSAYFYSPSRSVLVGGLMVIGVCLIAIAGTGKWEEIFLTLGGASTIVVALVPTGPAPCDLAATGNAREIVDRAHLECFPHESGAGLPGWVVEAVENNVFSLVIVGGVALVAAIALTDWNSTALGTWLVGALVVFGAVLVIGAVLFWRWDDFRDNTHFVAGVAAFGFFGLVAALNGWKRPSNTGVYAWCYRAVTLAMALVALAFVVVKVVAGGFRTDVFWLEAIEIALFGSFWLAQTAQHWSDPI